ncbi:hypothetical protein OROMI_002016 [Orobanche minor]
MACCNNNVQGLKPTLLMILAQTILAVTNILYKLAMHDGMPVPILVAYRFIFSAAFILPLAFFIERKKRPKLTWKTIFYGFVCGLFGITRAESLLEKLGYDLCDVRLRHDEFDSGHDVHRRHLLETRKNGLEFISRKSQSLGYPNGNRWSNAPHNLQRASVEYVEHQLKPSRNFYNSSSRTKPSPERPWSRRRSTFIPRNPS